MIVHFHRLGKFNQGQTHPRTEIYKLHWFRDREAIWDKRREFAGSKLFLSEDFPAEIIKCRGVLLPVLRPTKSKGMNASLSVDQLTINCRIYKHNTMNQIPRDLDPKKIATHTNGKITAFFTAASPLSNHYECEIRDKDGVIWPNVEGYYLSLKAKHFNDYNT